MSTSVFLNFIKLLKNREQINKKIKRLPYNAYYLAAKHIGGNYRFDKNKNIYYEDVVIDCNSFLGIVVRDRIIFQTTNKNIVKVCYDILRVKRDTNVAGPGTEYEDCFFVSIYSKIFELRVRFCYLCGGISHRIRKHMNWCPSRICHSRRCINSYGDKCHICFKAYDRYPNIYNFDCICKEKYIDQKAESYFNIEKIIRNIIALG